jgi:hypothetical protein
MRAVVGAALLRVSCAQRAGDCAREECVMFSQKMLVHLDVGDAGRSAIFYEALLGVAPVRPSPTTATFDLDSPPLLLTIAGIEPNDPIAPGKGTTTSDVLGHRRPRARRTIARDRGHSGLTLVVNEPRHVGDAAIALRRVGARIRIEDHGIAVRDPDDNACYVRFEPSARGRAVVETTSEDAQGTRRPRP